MRPAVLLRANAALSLAACAAPTDATSNVENQTEAVGQATESVSQRAEEAWKDSAPQRRDAEMAARRASRDAVKWSRRTWQRDVRPNLREFLQAAFPDEWSAA